MREYNFSQIEEKWQQKWKEENIFKTENKVEGKRKLLCFRDVTISIWKTTCWSC